MISIIVISYNTITLTIRCLESVFQYGKDTEIEVFVVDNASTDGSPDAIRQQFPQVILLENKKNVGFAKANNQAIRKAEGDFALLLNSDTEITSPDTLQQLIETAQTQPKVGAVVPKLLNSDGSRQPSAFYLPTVSRAFQEYWLDKTGYFSKYLPPQDKITTVEAAVMAAMLIPRSTVEHLGLLDERYFMYYEDIDYCRRIQNYGLNIYYDPSIEIIHHHGSSGQTQAPQTNQWKRLIPSSKIYHGFLSHYLLTAILWSGQKFHSK